MDVRKAIDITHRLIRYLYECEAKEKSSRYPDFNNFDVSWAIKEFADISDYELIVVTDQVGTVHAGDLFVDVDNFRQEHGLKDIQSAMEELIKRGMESSKCQTVAQWKEAKAA